jgi:hypothetical protein
MALSFSGYVAGLITIGLADLGPGSCRLCWHLWGGGDDGRWPRQLELWCEGKLDLMTLAALRDFRVLSARLLRDFSRERCGTIGTKTRAPGVRH